MHHNAQQFSIILVFKNIKDSYIIEHNFSYINYLTRTETEFEDALIGKLFAFNFVNSYASLFYIAFIKQNFVACTGSCIEELAIALAIIFGKYTTIAVTITIIFPLYCPSSY